MELTRIIVIYETQARSALRLQRYGYSWEIAREIAVYLAQSTDLPDFFGDIEAGARAQGVKVDFLELDDWLERLPAYLPEVRTTLVWSLGDGVRYYRGASVAALSRLAGFARFGAPATTQHLAQDKFASLSLAAASGLPVPPTLLMEGREIVARLGALEPSGPLFVKPNRLGAKIGIFADSRCASLDEAAELADRLWSRYQDRAVVQPFVAGDDVRVSYIDLGKRFEDQLGIEKIAKDARSETGGEFLTMKDNETLSGARDGAGGRGAFGQSREAAFTPHMIDLKAAQDPVSRRAASEISRHVARLARTIGLQDYFSCDFRIDAEGHPTFFEFETGPGVTIYDFQSYLARVHGLTLGEALARAMKLAYARSMQMQEA